MFLILFDAGGDISALQEGPQWVGCGLTKKRDRNMKLARTIAQRLQPVQTRLGATLVLASSPESQSNTPFPNWTGCFLLQTMGTQATPRS